ncbi:hypothetical protein SAMN04515647_3798 [Cohaesibacter sp. ES.047]|uniref:pyocin knob domain-containing protein n=1 Tax=Cohaesibacter sp. ES.047 TaxID=1798205 RepID=UPI000BC0CD91|nr:pyocin knob domain-containing protein [Cohaesibacter sp. ES.047]SNY93501.1 hypothetical protein SAMN04515647_3798 [Cohaesibacter sp. ES.047]
MSENAITQDNREKFYTSVAGQTEFPVTFKFQQDDDLEFGIIAEDGLFGALVLGADFSVSGAENDAGGTVTLLAPAIAGTQYRLRGKATLELNKKLTGARYSPETTNSLFERSLIWIVEQVRDVNAINLAFDHFTGVTLPVFYSIRDQISEQLQTIIGLEASTLAAKNDAVSAKDSAVSAKTNAETANSQAQVAKFGSETARDIAQSSASSATSKAAESAYSAIAAEASRQVSEAAQDASEGARDRAEIAATNAEADAILTAADRIQTGLDRQAAAESAAVAELHQPIEATASGRTLINQPNYTTMRDLLELPSIFARISPATQDTGREVDDWDNANSNGIWMGDDAANAPKAGWFIGEVQSHNKLWLTQRVWGFSSDHKEYLRFSANGTWSGWMVVTGDYHKVWHPDNDGHGSGLDADTLDGFHASQFARDIRLGSQWTLPKSSDQPGYVVVGFAGTQMQVRPLQRWIDGGWYTVGVA